MHDDAAAERLATVTEMMRLVSTLDDPQEMAQAYGRFVRKLNQVGTFVSVSRRGLEAPWYRITRSLLWEEAAEGPPDPWSEVARLPLLDRGVLGELVWAGEPRIVDDFQADPSDAAFEHLGAGGFRSLMALPLFEDGEALNMVVALKREPNAFDRAAFADQLWTSNLFGRFTHNLVLRRELKRAHGEVDAELSRVSAMQRSLLPKRFPELPGVGLAASYVTSRQAGGDYYDFFPLDGGKLGLLVADVSGHGTPAAVTMAVVHAIAHTRAGPAEPPGEVLASVNDHLEARYTRGGGTFVTAFYGVFDPTARTFRYASAGHNPPLVRGPGGTCRWLDAAGGLPLGIMPGERYAEATCALGPGDTLVLYTDGLVEARAPTGEFFGAERFAECACAAGDDTAQALVAHLTRAVDDFTGTAPPADDQTVVVMKVGSPPA